VATDLETLRRWEAAGGAWFVSSRGEQPVTISLRRCDGGEEVDRLVSRDPALLEYVESRPSSEADEPPGAPF
jgi:hypothetical protein